MNKGTLISLVVVCLAIASSAFAQSGPPQEVATAADKTQIKQLERSYLAAKKAFAKAPKSAKAKKDYVSITDVYANESMMTPALDRKIKYRQALHLFREVLKVEPSDAVAKKQSDFLIKIYKQLGRPVPQG